jgi:hypothetical protein
LEASVGLGVEIVDARSHKMHYAEKPTLVETNQDKRSGTE